LGTVPRDCGEEHRGQDGGSCERKDDLGHGEMVLDDALPRRTGKCGADDAKTRIVPMFQCIWI
jgi:hypothetical protein